MAAVQLEEWSGENASVREIERRLAALRNASELDGSPFLRTSVLTHIAWVPGEWEQAALDTLEGLAERHPSRVILLLPDPSADDGLDAQVSLRCFPMAGSGSNVCSELIELRLRGARTRAAASIVAPLVIADLPVFLRWRGRPPFGDESFERLVELADRLVVDGSEWRDVPGGYRRLAEILDRVAVSDIAWGRGLPWRGRLAARWPAIASIRTLDVRGSEADARLLAGWLRSRLRREIELEHEPAAALEAVAVDGDAVEPPPGEPPTPSDLLSDELDQFGRDPIYEAALQAAV